MGNVRAPSTWIAEKGEGVRGAEAMARSVKHLPSKDKDPHLFSSLLEKRLRAPGMAAHTVNPSTEEEKQVRSL